MFLAKEEEIKSGNFVSLNAGVMGGWAEEPYSRKIEWFASSGSSAIGIKFGDYLFFFRALVYSRALMMKKKGGLGRKSLAGIGESWQLPRE